MSSADLTFMLKGFVQWDRGRQPSSAGCSGGSLGAMPARFYRWLLLFSSDRPGGQGGYDLYLTALPQSLALEGE